MSSSARDLFHLHSFLGTLSRRPIILLPLLTQTVVSLSHTLREFSAHTHHILARQEAGTSWHNIISFSPAQNNYLKTLNKGSQVYVEANFELREPEATADPSASAGQRQIFLRHGMVPLNFLSFIQRLSETIRVLRPAPSQN